jgi:large subunit ribosomal protein L19
MDKIKEIEKDQLQKELPQFGAGDTVRVHYKIKEGDKERIQIFQGVVF